MRTPTYRQPAGAPRQKPEGPSEWYRPRNKSQGQGIRAGFPVYHIPMDKRGAAARAMKLRTEIRRLNKAYFIENKSDASEDVRDALKQELIALEERFPDLVTPHSPTQRAAAAPHRAPPKVPHPH